MNEQERLDSLWRYEVDALHAEYDRHSPQYWNRSKWAYRIAAVVLLAALVWTAFHSERRGDVPHYPTHTEATR